MGERVPIFRQDLNGLVTDGTAARERTDRGWSLTDFRDLDGNPLVLPPGSSITVNQEYLTSSDDDM
jgi:hypothetical protein